MWTTMALLLKISNSARAKTYYWEHNAVQDTVVSFELQPPIFVGLEQTIYTLHA